MQFVRRHNLFIRPANIFLQDKLTSFPPLLWSSQSNRQLQAGHTLDTIGLNESKYNIQLDELEEEDR